MSIERALERIAEIRSLPFAGGAGPELPLPAPSPPARSFPQLLEVATSSPPQASNPYAPEIAAAAARYGVDPALIRAVIQHESGFDPASTSSAGAAGLMQLMPGTATSLGVTDPYDPVQSIDGGTRYLRSMLDRFGGDVALALAAYNAGPGAVARYGGIPPYTETQRYVERVLADYQSSPAFMASTAAASLGGTAA